VNAETMGEDYFRALYARDPDPWRFADSAYEQDKYARTLEALAARRYAQPLEVGCSIGVLTRMLAERCDRLLAIDIASAPLVEARRRCAAAPWVRFAQMAAPAQWPDDCFDLIVLSEVVYYLSAADVGRLSDRIKSSLTSGGDLLLVHWTGPTNYPLGGDEASELLLERVSGIVQNVRRERFDRFRIDFARRA
jgi:cyclopropane fatty-acyl-phospholipid synthase-like methyltransferase